ncbi:MAG: sulfotransferase family protein [Acidimicrobiales bacterium]
MMDRPPFLLVVGCGRSGTTVLRTVLDSHPELAVAHEGRFVVPLGLRRARYERPGGFDGERFVHDMAGDAAVRTNLGLDDDELRTLIGERPVVDFPDAARRVFARYASKRGKPRYGDKMPGYVLRIPLLAAMFPEARLVHIIRDGRDVALSSMAIDGNAKDPVELAINWTTRVGAGRAAGRDLGRGRYREVRYEALVAEPEPVASELCEFLDLDFEPAMLRFFERADGVPAKVQANPRHARLAEPLSPGRRSWRTEMSTADLERFEAVAGARLDELGYERGVARPSLPARLDAARGRLMWHAGRARTRLPGMVRRAGGASR